MPLPLITAVVLWSLLTSASSRTDPAPGPGALPRIPVVTTDMTGNAGAGHGTAEHETGNDLITVELATVGLDRHVGTPLVLLRDPESGNVVPIWVGVVEAQAIAMALHGVRVPRPMTHDLMASLLAELRAEVEEVVVHDLRENTYFGSVRLRVAGERDLRTVDSRPSDALALALRTGARISVARRMLVEPPAFDFVAPEGPEQVVHALGITVVGATESVREQFGLPVRPGVVVTHVFGRARDEGLQRGDLILEINGAAVLEPMDYFGAIRATPPGDIVKVTYWRDNQTHELELPVDLPPHRPPPGTRVVA